ncbi:hypothetical protein [Lysinibacillus pakistanensis]|uniref:hypothetical protein n=1 Tax=Lysinibacillus pakistanensis TaxID=759811 RepID=UPI003D2ADF3E
MKLKRYTTTILIKLLKSYKLIISFLKVAYGVIKNTEEIKIKVKNPFSNKRYNKKERLKRKVSSIIIPLIVKLYLEIDDFGKSNLIPKSVKDFNRMYNYKKNVSDKLWDNSKPDNIEVDLITLTISEYVPIENIDELEKTLNKLLKTFKPKSFIYNDKDAIKNFCDDVSQRIHGKSWSRLGLFEINASHKLSKLVKSVEITAAHFSTTSIMLNFEVKPSEEFLKQMKLIMEKNIVEEILITSRIRKIFKSWNYSMKPGDSVKRRMIEDLIIELKYQTMKVFNKKNFLFFTGNKIIPPSTETYKIKQNFCIIEQSNYERNFFDSIGFRNHYKRDISKDGFWQINSDDNEEDLNSSIKFICNTTIDFDRMYGYLENYIDSHISEITRTILPILVIRDFTNNLSKNIGTQQKELFISMKKSNPKYKEFIKVRYELERSIQILKRFISEIGKQDYEWVRRDIKHMLDKFEPSEYSPYKTTWVEVIISNTEFLINETFKKIQGFSGIIDETVRIMELKTNNSLRTWSFSLTIVTIFLSIIATVTAVLSLYMSLDNQTQSEIIPIFSEIVDKALFWDDK